MSQYEVDNVVEIPLANYDLVYIEFTVDVMAENLSAHPPICGGVSWGHHALENGRVGEPPRNAPTEDARWRGRLRTLNCLVSIAQVADAENSDLAATLDQIVRLLPSAWRHPDICRARLLLDEDEYRSPAFRPSRWHQSADVVVFGQKRGAIETHYVERMPDRDEGPFLKEERDLLGQVAQRVARLVERRQTERKWQTTVKELQTQCAALQQSNAALHGAVERATAEKRAAQEAIAANVDKVLMPLLAAMDQELPTPQRRYVSLLRDNLAEITSPFADRLSRTFVSLTAIEIRICQMIRDGLSTKRIAESRHVSPATVARQRERIRHKLGLIGTDANLATYLRTFLAERG